MREKEGYMGWGGGGEMQSGREGGERIKGGGLAEGLCGW